MDQSPPDSHAATSSQPLAAFAAVPVASIPVVISAPPARAAAVRPMMLAGVRLVRVAL